MPDERLAQQPAPSQPPPVSAPPTAFEGAPSEPAVPAGPAPAFDALPAEAPQDAIGQTEAASSDAPLDPAGPAISPDAPRPISEVGTFRRSGRSKRNSLLPGVIALAAAVVGVVILFLVGGSDPEEPTPPVADVGPDTPAATPDVPLEVTAAPPDVPAPVPDVRAELPPAPRPDVPRPDPVTRTQERRLWVAKQGQIQLLGVPLGMPCSIGGAAVARARLEGGQPVEPGEHEVACDNPATGVWRRTIAVARGERVTIRYYSE